LFKKYRKLNFTNKKESEAVIGISKMKTNKLIQNELEQISAIVAEMAYRNVFKVPPHYFENLDEQIIGKMINLEDDVLNFSKSNQFNTPENYFEDLAEVVLLNTTASQFNDNEVELSKVSNFSIPTNYFENFSESILNKVKSTDIEETIEASKINTFDVPDTYFEINENRILQVVKKSNHQTGKLILWFNKTSVKFTAAASVAAFLIGVALYFNIQQQSANNQKLTAQEIKCYLQNNTEDVEDLQLTETPIIKAAPVKNVIKKAENKEIEKNELKEYLENELDESVINEAI
jgi:hypothetical protein